MPGDVVHRLRQAAANGRPAGLRGLWVSFLSAYGLEVAASCGADWLCLDLQHGDLEVADVAGLLRVAEASDLTLLVRLPSHDAGTIGRLLDVGVDGLIVPCVESPAQARALVAAARFPPVGGRSSGSSRTVLGLSPRTDEPLLLLMVESAAGLEQVSEIAGTAGVDGIFVGPYDLSLSLGATPGEPEVQAAIRSVVDTVRSHRKVVGMYAGRPDLLALTSLLDLVAVDSDVTALRAGLRALFEVPGT